MDNKQRSDIEMRLVKFVGLKEALLRDLDALKRACCSGDISNEDERLGTKIFEAISR